MDWGAYSPEIRDLIREYEALINQSDRRAIRVCKKLQKMAVDRNDDLLLGSVYHRLAFVEYFICGHYEAFLRYMRLAAQCLLRFEGSTEIAHVYYLIAIDALNKGMYDIALSDFLEARDLFASAGESGSAAILDLNVGHVLQQLNSYRKAAFYMRRARKGIRKNKEHPHYYTNIASTYMNEGICDLGLGRISLAEEARLRTERFLSQHEGRFHTGTRQDFLLFSTRLALAKEDRSATRQCFSELLEELPNIPQIANFIEELRRLADSLLAAGAIPETGKLLDTLKEISIPERATNAQRILIDMQINYYTALGDRSLLLEAYERQHAFRQSMLLEQRDSYRHTAGLIRLISDLRREQEIVRSEHSSLLYLSRNDALTGLPNRDSMNEHLDLVFERSLAANTLLGVNLIDVDELKIYNDTYGHPEGDLRLQEFGALLLHSTGQKRIFAARYGGDEFVVIYEDMSDEDILLHAEAIAAQSPLRISQGICNLVPTEQMRVWDYLSRADSAMYRAKENARATDRGGIGFYQCGGIVD